MGEEKPPEGSGNLFRKGRSFHSQEGVIGLGEKKIRKEVKKPKKKK